MSALLSFYPEIKQVHIGAVISSGSLFTLRGLALLSGMHWPRAPIVRWLSYSIDTVLLTAALMLLHSLPWGLFANGWLWVKLTGVLSYILLGIAAFRPARRPRTRAMLLIGAWLCFAQVWGIARMHHPLGWLLFLGLS